MLSVDKKKLVTGTDAIPEPYSLKATALTTSPSRSWGFGGVKWQCMPPGTPERCHLFFLQRMLLENGLNSLENAMEKGAVAELKKSRKQWARSFNLSAKRTLFYPLDYQRLHAPMVKREYFLPYIPLCIHWPVGILFLWILFDPK